MNSYKTFSLQSTGNNERKGDGSEIKQRLFITEAFVLLFSPSVRLTKLTSCMRFQTYISVHSNSRLASDIIQGQFYQTHPQRLTVPISFCLVPKCMTIQGYIFCSIENWWRIFFFENEIIIRNTLNLKDY